MPQAVEVESCKVDGLTFCIWFEVEQYWVEDMEANKLLSYLGLTYVGLWIIYQN